MTENIKNTKLLLLDLDGTVYLDDSLIGDVKNTLQYMRDKGVTIGYVSNNSSRTNKEYVKKIKKLGIFGDHDLFYSSLDATISYLNNNYKTKTVYPLASKNVIKELKKNGVKVDYPASVMLLTFDKTLSYEKLTKATNLLCKGATYIATHPDSTCPAKECYIPDVGSFIKLLEETSNRKPDVIIGKPYSYIIDEISRKLKIEKENITMVGDRLHTDILFGVNANINTVLVLSGETTLEMANSSPIKADLTLQDINALKEYI